MPTRSPELLISTASAWRLWLHQNSTTAPVIWLVISKKTGSGADTPQAGLTYQEALDEALCYGWIDSGGCSRNESTRYLRFGPRKVKSPWSKRNISFIERLEREGKMAEPGRLVVRMAKENGFWQAAYSAGEPPEDLMDAVRQSDIAQRAWEMMAKSERYAILVRLGSLPIGSEARRKKIKAVEDALSSKGRRPIIPSVNKNKLETRSKADRKPATISTVLTRSSCRLADAQVANT